jgi:hypothetical protein
MTETEKIAAVIAAGIKAAMAPIVADVKVLQSQIAGWEARWGDIGALRERVAVVESRSKPEDDEDDDEDEAFSQCVSCGRSSCPCERQTPGGEPCPEDCPTCDPDCPCMASGKAAVLAHIRAAQLPLLERLAAVEARAAVPGPVGEPGPPGQDAPALDLDEVAKRAAALVPSPKDGPPGHDGEQGPPGHDAPAVDLDEIVRRAAALVPPPKDGRDGRDADPDQIVTEIAKAVAALPLPRDGQDGQAGADVSPEVIAALVDDAVRRAVGTLPAPKDGQPGMPGKDGVGVAGALIAKDGTLVLTLSDGTLHTLGVVVGQDGQAGTKGNTGQDGAPGLNGRDGTLEQLQIVRVDERTVEFCFKDGTPITGGRLTFPVLIYRNVYRAGEAYTPGDVVTFGNSAWTCLVSTTAKPGESKDWQLMVRRGGDGKPGPAGTDGKQGSKGDKGDPGRDYR